jgi:anti-sigma regulatory factor (Ser/Thr protein kinase)
MIYPAKMDELRNILEFIDDEACKVGFSSADVYQIQLASEEALVNVINYAYAEDEEGKLEIQCSTIDEEQPALEITIKDTGFPFNPLDYADPPPKLEKGSSVEERTVGGLGIFYMTQVMDKVTYQRNRDCNVLHLKKYLIGTDQN